MKGNPNLYLPLLVTVLILCSHGQADVTPSVTKTDVQTEAYSPPISRSRATGLSGGKMGDLMILDEMLNTGYDRRATPTNHMNYATTVECELFIRSFGSISPSTMDYEVDLYLRQTWHDQRLNHTVIREPLDLSDPDLVKAIWKPEVYFPNAKHGEFQYVTVPNVLIRINPQGYILYQLRLKLTFSCMMELSKFPLDNQVCTMEVASFSKTLKELRLAWKIGDAVKLHRELRMPQFEINKVVTSDCQESYQIGNYSCLVAEFHLRRSIGYHLVQSYLPTILIVSISWVSFWMDVDAVPGRTTLGITTLLTVSSKSSSIQGGLPQVSYVKAIDIWMGACTVLNRLKRTKSLVLSTALSKASVMRSFYCKRFSLEEICTEMKLRSFINSLYYLEAFVFTALLEFTFVNYMWRKKATVSTCERTLRSQANNLNNTDKNASSDAEAGLAVDINYRGEIIDTVEDCRYKRISRRVDEVSRWLFPVVFFFFLLGYWFYYFF